jgi:hypothetical protein
MPYRPVCPSFLLIGLIVNLQFVATMWLAIPLRANTPGWASLPRTLEHGKTFKNKNTFFDLFLISTYPVLLESKNVISILILFLTPKASNMISAFPSKWSRQK